VRVGDGEVLGRPDDRGFIAVSRFGGGFVEAAAFRQFLDDPGWMRVIPGAGGRAAGGDEQRLGLAPLQRPQHRVECAGCGGGGGDVTGAVTVRAMVVHADVPAGGGGVIGCHGLDREHDLNLVAGVEGGKTEQRGVHSAILPTLGFCWVERQGTQERADGLAHEAGVERATLVEDGGPVIWRCGVGG
jgi:hypothetical protein